jgi:hypothetical protein
MSYFEDLKIRYRVVVVQYWLKFSYSVTSTYGSILLPEEDTGQLKMLV